ncbi:hypothetical protein MXMO3_03546 (plasmid) [Maritalea myrionectae]|uniref:Uncharacterized protein n=1 Tax=Maritalea myrionectae TaxID=454601 RepID=A0A2R4MJ87_9HYPH|nr:hypothetical protein [Maritalea myrionectae]AVX06049.1 hypothetical protein MXMO3_03546 [Maritalea myrionectae]
MTIWIKSATLALISLILVSEATSQSTIRSLPTSNYVIGSYIAQIGYDDLFNSSGVRLTSPWQVLRQDRANFHRFGLRDTLDQSDSFFANSKNRAIMEKMLAQGSISAKAARDIMNGNALILVEIYGTGSTGRELHVTVAR